jgi:hypothetical protein
MPRDLAAPAIVIAHGAWADATNWREVIALLQAKGLLVVAVQSPLTALADDVDAVDGRSIIRHILSSSSAMTMEARSLRRPDDTRRLRPSSTSQRPRRTLASRRLMHKGTAERAPSQAASLLTPPGFSTLRRTQYCGFWRMT